MKILLVKPCWPYPYGKGEHTYNRIWPPLCLANCAAILERQGHDVNILDAHALRLKPRHIGSFVRGFDKTFITSSSLDRWQCPNIDISSFLETVKYIRAETDEVYVTGYHGTVDPMGILSRTQAKAVLRGAPEYVVSDIAQGKDLRRIDGITCRENGNVISNPDRKDFDLTDFPVPAFHLLDMKKYSYEILGNNFCLFELGRGCNFGCEFCNRIMYEPKLRTKTLGQICNEIKIAVERQGIRTAYFMDLEFLAYKHLVRGVCDFLSKQKWRLKWCCQTRADSLDKDILEKMKAAGCQLIHIGVEGGIQKYLDLSGKSTTEERLIEGFRLCKKAGIQTLAFFMFGFRGETEEDRERIFAFAKKLNPNFVSFHKVYPYLKSDMYLENVNADREVDSYVRKAFLRYYLRVGYVSAENIVAVMRSMKLLLGRLATLS